MRSASSAKSMIRMAFFLTMPISRNTPISAMIEKLHPEQQQRQHRADARRGQRGQHGDRVDQALVEDAEHDVDDDDGGEDQHRLLPLRLLRRARRALEAAAHVGRHADVGLGLLRSPRCASSSVAAFGEVERDRGRELGVLVADRGRRRRARRSCAMADSGTIGVALLLSALAGRRVARARVGAERCSASSLAVVAVPSSRSTPWRVAAPVAARRHVDVVERVRALRV